MKVVSILLHPFLFFLVILWSSPAKDRVVGVGTKQRKEERKTIMVRTSTKEPSRLDRSIVVIVIVIVVISTARGNRAYTALLPSVGISKDCRTDICCATLLLASEGLVPGPQLCTRVWSGGEPVHADGSGGSISQRSEGRIAGGVEEEVRSWSVLMTITRVSSPSPSQPLAPSAPRP